MIPFGVEIHFDPTSTQDKSRLHQFGTKVLPGVFIRYALNSEGGWTGDLIIADWRDIGEQRHVRCSRRKIQVHRSWNQSSAGKHSFVLFAVGFPKTRRSPSNLTPPDSRELRRGRGPSIFLARRGVTLCRAQGVTLCKKERSWTLLEADRDPLEARGRFPDLFIATMPCPENSCVYRRRHRSNFLQNTLTS